MKKNFPFARLAAAAMVLIVTPAFAQTPAPTPSQAESLAPLRLTLDEAVRLATDNNVDLSVDRLDPQISDTRVAQAYSAYLPTFNSTVQRNNQLSPPTSFLVGNEGVTTDITSSTIGVSQRLPWLGGLYSVAWDSSRTTSTSPFTNFNPSLGSRLQMLFSQPLLRDLRIDASRQQVITSRRNRDIADTRLKESTTHTVADVKQAYWALVGANAAVDVQQKSLDLAKQLEQNNRARVEVGQMPPLDLVSARAEVAQRDEALIIAQAAARAAEDRLRTLIMDPDSAQFWTVRLEPVDSLPVAGQVPDVSSAIAGALRDRADIVRARLDTQNAATSVKFFSNQRMPDLRLQANYLSNGIGGSRLLREGGFPGTVVGFQETTFGSVLDQLFRSDFPTWTVGFTLNYPIGRSADDAGLARARLEETQSKARLQSLEIKAARQIRQAAWDIETNGKRIETSRLARELAEQRLDAEQKRFEVGMSTSFLVVQAQRDLAEARNRELLAVLAHERSVIDFDSLQQAGPASTGGSAPAATATTTVTVPAAATVLRGGTTTTQQSGAPF